MGKAISDTVASMQAVTTAGVRVRGRCLTVRHEALKVAGSGRVARLDAWDAI